MPARVCWFLREVGWLRARKTTEFTKCGLCEFLVRKIQGSAPGTELRDRLMSRLQLHHQWQSEQRRAINNLIEESRRDPHSMVVFSIDKMDQQKSVLPHSFAMRASQFMNGGCRLAVGLIGMLLYAITHTYAVCVLYF